MITEQFQITGGISIGGESPPVFFAGPCVIEGDNFSSQVQMVFEHAKYLKELSVRFNIPIFFKASYDKANRTSIDSYRGPGIKAGLEIFSKLKRELRLPVITDAHTVKQIAMVAEVVDIIQIPAFLCRQTDLIVAAAKTGKAVNIKKGQFLAPWDVKNIIEKYRASGGEKLILTERGTSFGYNRLVVDFTGLEKMREFGTPVVFDATHSVQSPGGLGGKTGGESKYAASLSFAAAAVGVDGLFLETHVNPPEAKSDAANMVPLSDVESIFKRFLSIHSLSQI